MLAVFLKGTAFLISETGRNAMFDFLTEHIMHLPKMWSMSILALWILLVIAHVVHALVKVKSSQAATSWMLALAVFPWIVIPFYWLIGRSQFDGYTLARREKKGDFFVLIERLRERAKPFLVPPSHRLSKLVDKIGGLPFLGANRLDILRNGHETFERLFAAMEKAESYLCVNFYIVKNDRIGQQFRDILIDRARAGVKVYFIFDEIGSHKLSRAYLQPLRDAGVQLRAFGKNRFWFSRFQINFRNHRKIVVVDGELAFIGGINVGDEYLGDDVVAGKWRDTHMEIQGPAALEVQLVFLEDWLWASGETLDLPFVPKPQLDNQSVAIVPSGPADEIPTWQLLMAEAANSALERLWISTPYFVPDDGVLTALQSAALRGVDVRIMLPKRPDSLLVWLCSFTYFEKTLPYGIKLSRYQQGFLHQKAVLVDQKMAMIGSANMDNRSFFLNFEIMACSCDERLIFEMAAMLREDFISTDAIRIEDFTEKSPLFRFACRMARIAAPLL